MELKVIEKNEDMFPVYVEWDGCWVNLIDLYIWLWVNRSEKSWFLEKKEKMYLEEGVDFFVIDDIHGYISVYKEIWENVNVDRKELDDKRVKLNNIFVSIDTAKEICMVSMTKVGKNVRNYFIGIEKEYKKAAAMGVNRYRRKKYIDIKPQINDVIRARLAHQKADATKNIDVSKLRFNIFKDHYEYKHYQSLKNYLPQKIDSVFEIYSELYLDGRLTEEEFQKVFDKYEELIGVL